MRLLIGAQAGRSYIRMQNVGAEPQIVRVELERFSDARSGEKERRSRAFSLCPFEAGSIVYLDAIFGSSSWVAEWSLDPPPDGVARWASVCAAPEVRDAAPFFRKPPTYPHECRDRALDREVVRVRFVVTERGDVQAARILQSSNPCLDEAALAAAARWVYSPSLENGLAVKRRFVETTVVFHLEE